MRNFKWPSIYSGMSDVPLKPSFLHRFWSKKCASHFVEKLQIKIFSFQNGKHGCKMQYLIRQSFEGYYYNIKRAHPSMSAPPRTPLTVWFWKTTLSVTFLMKLRFQSYLCQSGVHIFTCRLTWNYTYSSVYIENFILELFCFISGN